MRGKFEGNKGGMQGLRSAFSICTISARLGMTTFFEAIVEGTRSIAHKMSEFKRIQLWSSGNIVSRPRISLFSLYPTLFLVFPLCPPFFPFVKPRTRYSNLFPLPVSPPSLYGLVQTFLSNMFVFRICSDETSELAP